MILLICIVYNRNFLWGILFIIPHEASHILCGLLLGYRLKGVRLLPFGMNAGFKDEFIKPMDDVLISFTGPLINFIFCSVFFFLSSFKSEYYYELFRINLALALFNLVPCNFLDGGRIAMSLIKSYVSYEWAYRVTDCTGLISGLILMYGLIYYKFRINGIILFIVGIYITFETVMSFKRRTIDIVKDEVNKQSYIYSLKQIYIRYSGFCENVKILDIIRNFCFNKYYVIFVISSGRLKENFDEKSIVDFYCSYGNITLAQCVQYKKSQED